MGGIWSFSRWKELNMSLSVGLLANGCRSYVIRRSLPWKLKLGSVSVRQFGARTRCRVGLAQTECEGGGGVGFH